MPQLVGSIVLHLALGVVLAAAVWAVGLGFVSILFRGGPPRANEAAFAYPLGLLALTVTSALYLVSPWLGALCLPGLALAVSVAIRRRTDLEELARRGAAVAAWAFPGTAALGVTLGLLWHGPTSRVESTTYGDLLYYASKLVSATSSITPLRDLLVEGQHIGVVEGAVTYLGGPASAVPGFDPILFQTTTLPALMLSALAIGIGVVHRPAGRSVPGRGTGAALGLLAVASIAYPSWLTESPPVALAVPLAVPMWALVRERLPVAAFSALSGVIALDLFLTKGFGLIPFAVLAIAAFARDHRPRGIRDAVPYAAGAAVIVGAGIAVFVATAGWTAQLLGLHFLPADAARGLWEQRAHRDTLAVAPAVQAVGQVLLLIALARARAYVVLAALATSMAAGWLVVGHGFDIATGTATLIAALLFLDRPEAFREARPWVALAAGCLALAAWFRDIAGVQAGFVLVASFALATVLAFVRAGGAATVRERRIAAYVLALGAIGVLFALAGRPALAVTSVAALAALPAAIRALPMRRTAWAMPALAVIVALAASAGSGVAASKGGLELDTARTTLTRDDYEVWREVERRVPADGLVFTSLTGPRITGNEGWNYYPGAADRQVYLAGWSNSSLHVHDAERLRRLAVNRAVLIGRTGPGALHLERRYASYWAVVRSGERVPASFRRAYANRRFALYRISSR